MNPRKHEESDLVVTVYCIHQVINMILNTCTLYVYPSLLYSVSWSCVKFNICTIQYCIRMTVTTHKHNHKRLRDYYTRYLQYVYNMNVVKTYGRKEDVYSNV